ncbi:MAG: Ger(x)C family spore germination protein, partial [Firmicutes bacterium]|nr:Ger(x)C family spore germination protein [Bacillota bacterium]
MRKTISITLIVVILVTMLTGCYDSIEIDEMTYVLAIGLDKGVKDKLRLTIEFHTMKGGSSSSMSSSSGGGGPSGGGMGGNYPTITIDAPSFYTGLNMINSSLPHRLNFMHAKWLVFSEEMAKAGVSTYIAPIIRYREIRRSMHVIVAKGSACKFLEENQPFIGSTLSKTMELQVMGPTDTGYFPHVTLNDFYNGIKSTYRQPIAALGGLNNFNNYQEDGEKASAFQSPEGQYYAGEMPRKGGSKVELYGTAVFDGDKMVGELTGDETRLLLMLMGDFKRGFFTIKDPKMPQYVVPLDVRTSRKTKIQVDIKNGKPYINAEIKLEGDILAIQSMINYEDISLKPLLEKAFEQQVKSEMDALIDKCKKEKSDVFRFGTVACRKFLTIQDWEQYNWNKQFENAEVTVNVTFNIRRTGTLMKSSPVISSE